MKKEYIITQESESDCGACCLYSIIRYFNGFVPLEIIKNDTLTTKDGTSFYNLKEAGEKYGFEIKGYNVNKLPKIPYPYIAQLKISDGIYHFVVIYNVSKDLVICMDPSIGLKKYKIKNFYDLFTGNILKLIPINQIIKYKENNYLKKILLKLTKKNIKYLLIILILSIVIILISIVNNCIIKILYTFNISKLVMLFIFLMLIKNIINYIKNSILTHLNKINNIHLIKHYIEHIFNLPQKFLQLKNKGEIISKLNNLENIKNFISKEIINIIISSIFLIILLPILYYLNNKVTIFLTCSTITYLCLLKVINNKKFYLYLNKLESEATYLNFLIEYINKIEIIKNLNKERYFLDKTYIHIQNENNNNYQLDKYYNKINIINNIYNDISIFIVIIISYYFKEPLDNIIIYILYYNYYIEIINYFASLIPSLKYLNGVVAKINSLYYIEEEKICKERKTIIGNIYIQNLSYKINLKNIISNLNIKINKGDKVLLKGENGTGKSTLLNILKGNINEYNGNIFFNNTLISKNNNSILKNNIYLCKQNDDLFIDTILNNIVLDSDYDNQKVRLIEKTLYLDNIINKQNYGYNTIIKENLSGGEKQLIIIARALYQDYEIILFDESFSEINYILRSKIINNINKNYKEKTIIFVSHNKEHYHFDKVINLAARKE